MPLGTIAKEWLRLGCIGFGGPPTHIVLLRRLCVEERQWIEAKEFEDAIATTNLLPGPASTQLAIYCAWRLRGTVGAVLGGLCFIVPGLVLILALSAVFLANHPPDWILGAAAGAGAAVPAVALQRGMGTGACQLEKDRDRALATGPLGRLRLLGRGRRCHGRALPGDRAGRLRGDRDHGPPAGPAVVTSLDESVHLRPVLHGATVGGLGAWPGWRSRSAPSPMAAGS